jgi:hypothetical protein
MLFPCLDSYASAFQEHHKKKAEAVVHREIENSEKKNG